MPKYFRKYNYPSILFKQTQVHSKYLNRVVTLDTYTPRLPKRAHIQLPVLFFNDGQILRDMNISKILRKLLKDKRIQPCILIGIHSNQNRNHELGTAQYLQTDGYGISAQAYQSFIIKELIPSLQAPSSTEFHIAGYSLGGLSALDIVLNHPNIFKSVGVFSGALWWRDKPFSSKQPNANLIIPKKISSLNHPPKARFWFQTGALDESTDRDNNGIIDTIDDTLRTIVALHRNGVSKKDISYLEIKGGKHNWKTWAKTMPHFLTTINKL